jgi:hypothetical protein
VFGVADKAPNQTPAITRAAPMTAGNVIGSLTTQAANANVTTGNRTNMYELAEAVHLRTTSKTRTNSRLTPGQP